MRAAVAVRDRLPQPLRAFVVLQVAEAALWGAGIRKTLVQIWSMEQLFRGYFQYRPLQEGVVKCILTGALQMQGHAKAIGHG